MLKRVQVRRTRWPTLAHNSLLAISRTLSLYNSALTVSLRTIYRTAQPSKEVAHMHWKSVIHGYDWDNVLVFADAQQESTVQLEKRGEITVQGNQPQPAGKLNDRSPQIIPVLRSAQKSSRYGAAHEQTPPEKVDSARSSSMAFLGKARKEDLIILARELEEEVTPDLKIISLRNLIVASTNYEMEFVKELLNTVISQRTEEAEQRKLELEIEERRKREEREFEL
ncbi:hypothetical protein AVEN_49409-1 [Araneus ventricosus]|uniref:Uncharacterized protein n=1 Tax=Araneus ventricosus TaxID=182803 RepID=A0A4Y2CNM9_ARAVE|nr:hypothetical protein AVEN_49409-1 [Araneus ventricosus]